MLIRALSLLILCLSTSWASLPTKKTEVMVGVYFTSLHSLDYANDDFNAGFYLWTVSKDKNYNPSKSLELTKALNYKFKNHVRSIDKKDFSHHVMHVYSTNFHYWDIKNFPFDTQRLKITIEDAEPSNTVVFIADKKESGISADLKAEGWILADFEVTTSMHQYDSNFGDYENDQSNYSKFIATITLKRQGARLFLSFYIGFIVAFILCSFIFFIDPVQINARSGFTLSSIVTAVGNKYVIDRYLPVANQFTLSDAIQLCAFGIILTAVLTTVITAHIVSSGQEEKAWKISKNVGCIVIPMFLSIFFYSLWSAVVS